MIHRVFLSVALVVALSAMSQADTILYVTGSPATTSSNLNAAKNVGDPASFFDIFIQQDAGAIVSGFNLDVFVEGSSIALTSATVPNYVTGATNRWASVTDGTISGDKKSATGLEGFALPGFGSTGINPAVPDSGFNGAANAFHFARVNYDVLQAGLSNIFLQVGGNEWSTLSPTTLRFGIGDAPICTDCAGGSGGTRSTVAEGAFTVAGGTVNLPPVVDALAPISVAWPATVANLQLTAHDDLTAANLLGWSNLVPDAGNPTGIVSVPTLGANGLFNWNPTGSKGGTYKWNATVADNGNPPLTGAGLALTINYTVPEPATLSLFGLALVGFVGFARRRS